MIAKHAAVSQRCVPQAVVSERTTSSVLPGAPRRSRAPVMAVQHAQIHPAREHWQRSAACCASASDVAPPGAAAHHGTDTSADSKAIRAALELKTRGWAVVEDVISPAECEGHIDCVWNWLEGLGTGIRRDDPSTWTDDHWPVTWGTTGVINRLEVAHQDFVWKLRADPRITGIFAALWGTDALLSSFDSINVMRPPSVTNPEAHADGGSSGRRKLWWHVDQAPHKPALECIQGLLNITPCGPHAGTLEVREASHAAHSRYWSEVSTMPQEEQSNFGDFYQFQPEEYQFWDSFKTVTVRGYGPGSLVLWDSRTVHQNRPPDDPTLWRHVLYTCYQPVDKADADSLAAKREAYESFRVTTHWPAYNVTPSSPNTPEEEATYSLPRTRHLVEDDVILRLAGMKPYDTEQGNRCRALLDYSTEELEVLLH